MNSEIFSLEHYFNALRCSTIVLNEQYAHVKPLCKHSNFSMSVDDLCEQSLKQPGNASVNINDWDLGSIDTKALTKARKFLRCGATEVSTMAKPQLNRATRFAPWNRLAFGHAKVSAHPLRYLSQASEAGLVNVLYGVFNSTLTPLIQLAGRPCGIPLPARATALQ